MITPLGHAVLNDKVRESHGTTPAVTRETLGEGADRRELMSIKGPITLGESHEESVMTLTFEITDLIENRQPGPQSRIDPLTQLTTAEAFADRAELELARARRQTRDTGRFLLVDIDRFKGINDAFGRAFGDELLRSVAGRLQARLREIDSIARLKSDEFVVLQVGLRLPDDAAELAHRLGEAFADPFPHQTKKRSISAPASASRSSPPMGAMSRHF